jgi:hypothetical protein
MNKKQNLAISFLCKDLHPETYNFGKQIWGELGVPVYFIIDSCLIPDFVVKQDGLNFITITDTESVQNGFHNCMITGQKVNTLLAKNPISYDKLLYFFCNIEEETDFMFVFEDDVFIPSIDAILNLLESYKEYDLVTPNHFFKDDEVWDWHWKSVLDKIKPPYYFSMVSAMGISRKLLNVIDDYVVKNNTLFFTEIMFNTLASQNKLKVTDAFELKSVVWQGEWGLNEFALLPSNVFHPKKDLENFQEYRDDTKKLIESCVPIEVELPPFIQELM